MQPLPQRLFKLGRGHPEVGAGRVEENPPLGLRIEPRLRHRAADHESIRRALDDLRERPVDKLIRDVHRPDQFQRGLAKRGLGDGPPDRPETLDDDGKGAGHGMLRSQERVSSYPR